MPKNPDTVYQALWPGHRSPTPKIAKRAKSSPARSLGIFKRHRKRRAKVQLGPYWGLHPGDAVTWWKTGRPSQQDMVLKASPGDWYTLDLGGGKTERAHAIALGPGVGPQDDVAQLLPAGPFWQFGVGDCVTYNKPGHFPRQATVMGRAPGDCYTIDMGEGQTPHVHASALAPGVALPLLDSLLGDLDLAGLLD